MHKGMKAYLFEGSTVVLDKSYIHNAKDEQFQEITLIISAEAIQDLHKELEMMDLLEDENEEDDFE